jgi:hydroxyacid-oxoacid transhydrogenase
MMAIPTTAGTGSETTGVTIFDYLEMGAKTGIASRALRPIRGIIDLDNTRTMPKMVAACTGLDQLTHALEALTTLPYNQRPAPEHPRLRPAYQGANPISNIWASRAIEMISKNLVRTIEDPSNDEARGEVLLAATYAGIGFGNGGLHLAHGMSYPVSGMAMARGYVPDGYPPGHPLVPHGMAVCLNAPAVFRFTAPANPALHLYAAKLMGCDVSHAKPEEAGEILAGAIIDVMRKVGIPNGLSAVGFGPPDLDKLVAGTLPQHRVTKLSPRPAGPEELRQLFLNSMTLW